MAPQEQDVADLANTNSNLRVVAKALELPVVSDAVTAATTLAGPYLDAGKPYLETIVKHGGPVLEDLYCKAESAVSEKIKTKITSAMENLDNLACRGLEKITEKVPNLKDPECVEKAKDSVMLHVHLTTEYLASFTVSQIGLGLGEGALGLLQAGSRVLLTYGQVPLISKLQRGVRAVKRAGIKRAGTTKPVNTLGEASLLGALAEMLHINLFLTVVGIQLEPRFKQRRESRFKVSAVKTVRIAELELGDQNIGDVDLADSDSDQDVDYSPDEASDQDVLEYDSQAEVIGEDEHAEVVEGESSDESSDESSEVIGEDEHAKLVEGGVEIRDVDSEDEVIGEDEDAKRDLSDESSKEVYVEDERATVVGVEVKVQDVGSEVVEEAVEVAREVVDEYEKEENIVDAGSSDEDID